MDIALKLKRGVATLAAVSLFAANTSVALAQTFNDVATDAWFYDYVEQLVDDGVVDAADNYRPNDALNRAELVKIAITAIDGLAGYEAPATPTFDDVAADAWYFDYVEAAVQLGIVAGYTDASGNLTGMFGPGDVVNRAAATKILVNAFSVPTDLTPASIFPDVQEGAWFYDYVVTAYNQSIVDGYQNGYFGPADPVTRAQVAKLTVLSQSPTERAAEEGEEDEEEPVGTSDGDLEVSLNDDTPSSSTIPKSASSVDLLTFDITASDDDVNVSNIVVTRGGVGQVTDWDALYLYEGTKRLTSGRTLNSDTNTATFPVNLNVEAGTTTTLTLVGDMGANPNASNQHYFYVASAADITSNAQSVAGDFPVAGNTFTTGSVAVETLTVAAGSTPSAPQIGQKDAEITSFKLTSGSTNDIALHQITLTQNGTLDSQKLSNLRLLRGTDEVATAEGFDGDLVTFVLDTPFVIPKGQNKTFYVRADIDGGRSTDTVDMYVDENTDVVAIDQQYGFGALITNSNYIIGSTDVTLKGGAVTVSDNGPPAAQIASNATNVTLLDYSIASDRDLTVRDMDVQVLVEDPAGAIPDVEANLAANIGITSAAAAANPVTTDEYCIRTDADQAAGTVGNGDMIQIVDGANTYYARVVTLDNGADGTADACAGADDNLRVYSSSSLLALTGAAVYSEVNVYSYLKNVKVVDTDSGGTVSGPLTLASQGTKSAAVNTNYLKSFSEDYDLTGGEARHLAVVLDTDINLVAGYRVKVRIDYTVASRIKDFASNEFVAIADIVGGNLTSKTMTVANNSLTVSSASTPTSQTYVKGEEGVPTLGIALKAGDAGAVTLKKLVVRIYGDDDGTFDAAGLGDVLANNLISSVTLYDGADVVSGPKGISSATTYYTATFDDLNIKINKGATKTLTAKVKLLNTTDATRYLAVDIKPADDIIAEDEDSNTITAATAAAGGQLNFNAAPNPLITINTGGTLNIFSENNPEADILLAGTSDQLVSKYRFNAVKEGFTVRKLTIINDATGVFDTPVSTSAVSTVTVKYKDVNGADQSATSSMSGGSATFSGLDFYVPKDGNATLDVYANVNSKGAVGASISGKTFRLGMRDTANTLSTFEAVGVASSTSNTAGSAVDGATVKEFVVRTAVPTFAKVDVGTNLINGERDLYKFTATGNGSFGLVRLVFPIVVTDSDAGGELLLSDLKLFRQSTYITDAGIYDDTTNADVTVVGVGTINMGTDDIVVTFASEESISSSVTYTLKATVAGVEDNDSVNVKIATGDESTVVSGLTINNGNANTGKIFDANANEGLFGVVTDFAQVASAARNVIWSDKSSDAHQFNTGDALGSDDWTNGYLLGITELASQTLNE